jgi:hypothetical protein
LKTQDAYSLREDASITSNTYERIRKELFERRQSLSNDSRLAKEALGPPQNAKVEVDSSPATVQNNTVNSPPVDTVDPTTEAI